MNANDRIILEQIIDQQHQERASTSPKQEFFEIFVAEQALKDHDLGYDEIESGIVGGGNNLIFYVAMRVAAIASGKNVPAANNIAAIDPGMIGDDTIRESIEKIKRLYKNLGGGDQVAKGGKLVEELKAEIETTLS